VAKKARQAAKRRSTSKASTDPDWLALSGWSHRFARVLADAVVDRFGVAMIDSNNDRRELSVLALQRENHDVWRWAQEHDDAGPSGEQQERDFVYAWGTGLAHGQVKVAFAGKVHVVPVAPSGAWVFVWPKDDDADALPTRLD
jgi:hypothetical protein